MQNSLNAYKQINIKTAGPGRLVIMLYDGVIKNLGAAEEEFKQENPQLDLINNALTKAQEIISELQASLSHRSGQEIAEKLFNLYSFFNQEILEINLQKDPKKLPEIRQMIQELRDTWVQVEKENPSYAVPASSGVNVAG